MESFDMNSQKELFRMESLENKTSHETEEPIVIVGTLGHVSHGKSTIVHKLSGIKPQKHSQELSRNITIKLGYANFNVYTCNCPYFTTLSEPCAFCGTSKLFKRFSFVDCPGHECLMATMINGASVMDMALLVIAANQPVPQPQTREHLAAAEMMGLKRIIVCQTKLDLVSKDGAQKNAEEIREFIKGTVAEGAPIIPISCVGKLSNIDVLLQAMCSFSTIRKNSGRSVMKIVRSFDVNKPGDDAFTLKGGVIGGVVSSGNFEIGEKVRLLPGLPLDDQGLTPLETKIVSIRSQNDVLIDTHRGGLLALGTNLDPCLSKSDKLVGQIVIKNDEKIELQSKLTFTLFLMKRVEGQESREKTASLKIGNILYIHVSTNMVKGKVEEMNGRQITVKLSQPCCLWDISRVAISRKIEKKYRLIGVGVLTESCSEKSSETKECRPFSGLVMNYDDLLNVLFSTIPKKKKLILKPPKINNINKRTVWENFLEICDTINRPHDHLLTYLMAELAIEGSVDSQGHLILRGYFTQKQIESIVKKYIRIYVLCKTCGSYETKIEKSMIQCSVCQCSCPLEKIEIGYRAKKKGQKKQTNNDGHN